MHTLPDEIGQRSRAIGTSTLLAAWNAAIYVAQIDDERVTEAMSNSGLPRRHPRGAARNGELWFNDESYVISRLP